MLLLLLLLLLHRPREIMRAVRRLREEGAAVLDLGT
jgi:hypothetical protein